MGGELEETERKNRVGLGASPEGEEEMGEGGNVGISESLCFDQNQKSLKPVGGLRLKKSPRVSECRRKKRRGELFRPGPGKKPRKLAWKKSGTTIEKGASFVSSGRCRRGKEV